MEKREGTIYEDNTLEGLLNLWVEAKSEGLDGLCDEIWNMMVLKDKLRTEKKLKDLRRELEEPIIGC